MHLLETNITPRLSQLWTSGKVIECGEGEVRRHKDRGRVTAFDDLGWLSLTNATEQNHLDRDALNVRPTAIDHGDKRRWRRRVSELG